MYMYENYFEMKGQRLQVSSQRMANESTFDEIVI
jgi:hypothetical protein